MLFALLKNSRDLKINVFIFVHGALLAFIQE
jgi:hypothetical protein